MYSLAMVKISATEHFIMSPSGGHVVLQRSSFPFKLYAAVNSIDMARKFVVKLLAVATFHSGGQSAVEIV